MKNLTLICAVLVGALAVTDRAPAQQLDYASYFFATPAVPFTETLTFSLTDYSPSELNSFFSVFLGNGAGGGPVTADLVSTVYLENSTTATIVPVPSLTLDTGLLTSPSQTIPATYNAGSAGFPAFLTGPSGDFNEIVVDVTGTLSAGAFVSFLGQVNVVPEPSTPALLIGGLILGGFLIRGRLARA